MTTRFIIALVSAIYLMPTLQAAEEKEEIRNKNKEQLAKELEERKQTLGENENIMLDLGLIADKEKREIRIAVENNGLGKRDPAEFMIIGEMSDHDYEAVATALCTPTAFNNALTFIGMVPGQPADYKALRMWPRGERVIIHYEWDEEKEGKTIHRRERAEKFIWNMETQSSIIEEGWVYLGSRIVTNADTNKEVLAAEIYGPNALASTFNSRDNVLEVPRLSYQDHVYDIYEMNPEFHMKKGTLLEAVITPEFTDGTTRVRDYTLTISSREKKDGDAALDHLQCAWQEVGIENTENYSIKELIETLKKIHDSNKDANTTLTLDPTLSCSDVRAIYFILDQTAQQGLIRLSPPADGHLFYRAWLPPEEWRERKNRISQPLELTLSKTESGLSGTLAIIQAEYLDDQVDPKLTVTELPVADPEALKPLLAEHKNNLPVLLIFSPPDMTRAELHTFIDAAKISHPTIHIYVSQ